MHRIIGFDTRQGLIRLSEIVNEWLDKKEYRTIFDIKYSSFYSNGATHYSVLIHYEAIPTKD
jgi:hypothetical protein